MWKWPDVSSLKPRAIASTTVVTVSALSLSVLALTYEGIPTAALKLDDGGVWVTNSTDLHTGHLNYPSRLLDGATKMLPGEFDVAQSGDTVLVHHLSENSLAAVDPSTFTLSAEVALPSNSTVALGHNTVAIAGDGLLWVVGANPLAPGAFDEDSAIASLVNGAIAVSQDGTRVFAASGATAELLTFEISPDTQVPATEEPHRVPLQHLQSGAQLSVTAVGNQPVVLDSVHGVMWWSNGKAVAIPSTQGAVLQQPGGAADYVSVASPTSLIQVPLGKASPLQETALATQGIPSAPVALGGCTYAVWSGSPQYVRDCAGETSDVRQDIDASPGASLVLRSNRRVVVINDTLVGTVWLADQDMYRVDNWQDVIPPPGDDSNEEDSPDETVQFDLPERKAENQPPDAVNDRYGVRPGKSTILRVTENDTDPDGDLLSATVTSTLAEGFHADSVLDGSAIQLAVPSDATGTITFTYQVDDGRGGTDTAQVTVEVHSSDANEAPEQRRVNTLYVEVGASVTTTALDGWFDPDGDDFYLKSASVDSDDEVTFRANGALEFRAISGEMGIRTVTLLVSDGVSEAEGTLRVEVRAVGTLDPVANADRVTTIAGTPVVVAPLLNDVSPSGGVLRLAKHDQVPGATITPNFADDTFEFVADNPGTYYVQYLVTDGPRTSAGIVRIDVVAVNQADAPPIAARDVALLPRGREVLVDVLPNDSDPSGGVLVVLSAQVSPGSGIAVEVLDHAAIRVTDVSGLTTATTFTYTISNGRHTAVGEVLVMPVDLPEKLRPPVTVEDTATVRAGDVVTVPVLSNDFHPDGDTIVLLSPLVETDAAEPDRIFVDGNTVRYHAPDQPGTVHATYEVEDSQGNRTAGYLTIQVLPADTGQNAAPQPKPVTARVIAGSAVRVAIPLDGIDPDGDSVELIGLASNPLKGYATVSDTWITYTAYPEESGVDSFRYLVRDRLGAVAESTVTVGVALPGLENQAPYAAKDMVTVKPGRSVAVSVTVNDSDPDGDEIALVSDGLTVPAGIDAEVVAGRVVVTAPSMDGDFTITYTIADSYGARAEAPLLVEVRANAEPKPPIARDDRVASAMITGATVTVPVLDNDEDPDGIAADLVVRTGESDVLEQAGQLVIPVLPDARVVRYSLTDQDGLTAQAFVFVPGSDTLPPTLVATEPVVAMSGQRVTFALDDYVHVRAGHVPRIAIADSIRTAHSNGDPLLVDEFTLQYTSAEGYFGPDSVGVLVTDGTGPDDPLGLSAFIIIPIKVLPTTNQSPTMRGATMTVAPGESAVVLDLARLATDPDEDDMDHLTFALQGATPQGFTASISGSLLTVQAAANVPADSLESLTIEVSDGTSAPGTGSITLHTVTSIRPLPVANDDVVADAAQGSTSHVDVLSNDFNPFEDQGPLTLVQARVDSGSGTAELNGAYVDITPAANFVGTMVVTYRMVDVTGAPSREAEARVSLTVRGRPDAPGTPAVTSVQDRTVVLSWLPPANNGAPITHYTVSSPQGFSQECASTTCTLTGLTNNTEYTFTVVATNEVGTSEPSPPSIVARPDARPGTPQPPVLAFGDRSLTVSWVTPPSTGSPVISYNLEISPAPAVGAMQRTGVTGNSMTWEGLDNGVAYQVRVQAVNRAPEPSEWSSYSSTMVPAAAPSAPGQPVSQPAVPVGAQAQITVNWTAPASDNGDPISGYTLYVKQGGVVVNTISTTSTSQNVTVGTSDTDFTFVVTARNKAGESLPSADSAPRRAATPPGAPTNVTLTPGDRSVTVAFTAGALNGSKANEVSYHYRVNQTGATGVLPANKVISGLTNGTSYTVNLWAVSTVQGVSPSAEATSTATTPFGAPIITHVSTTRGDGSVTFRWKVDSNGSTLTTSSHALDATGNGAYTQGGLSASQSTTLNVSYTNAAGTSTATWTGQANDPPPSVTLTKGNSVATNIWNLYIDAQYFAPNTQYTVGCYSLNSNEAYYTQQVTTNGNGAISTELYCNSGYSGTRASVGGVFSNSVDFSR